MDSNNITRQCIVAMHLRHGRRRAQRNQQCIHTRRGDQWRTHGAKRAMTVDRCRSNRGRPTSVVRGTDTAQRHHMISRQGTRKRRRCRHQRGKDHGKERDQGGDFFAAAGKHAAIITRRNLVMQGTMGTTDTTGTTPRACFWLSDTGDAHTLDVGNDFEIRCASDSDRDAGERPQQYAQ
jgi:hypothetical protein